MGEEKKKRINFKSLASESGYRIDSQSFSMLEKKEKKGKEKILPK